VGRRRTSSLRRRITVVTTAVVAVVLTVSSMLFVGWLRTAQLDDADQLLAEQIDVVEEFVSNGVLPQIIAPKGIDTVQLQIVGPDRRTLALTEGLATSVRLDVFIPPPVGEQESRTTKASELGAEGNDRYRVMARTVPFGRDWVAIYAATPLRNADQVVRTVVIGLTVMVPILVLLAGLAAWVLIGRALRPVETMRREVEAIRGTGADQRLSPDQRAAELDGLAATMNDLLERLSESEEIRRQFMADASHELRSPLASARTMLEVGLAYPDRTDWPGTADEVMVEIERLEGLAGELLALARAEGGERALVLEPTDLTELVVAEVQRSNDARVTVHAAGAAPVMADRALLVRAVRNVLDNARRHAETKVTVNVGGGERASLQVYNDGEEISAEQREYIFEPFTRLDGARARDEGGAGLGLSIARRIAEVHGGSLEVVDVTHGAAFLLTLPAAPDPD
jgi:signal transduction histidine kinase